MARQLQEFKDYIQEKLKDPEYALAYLNAALEDEDKSVFLIALKDVIEAYESNKSNLAKLTNVSRPTIYRALSKTGNPRWDNITSIVNAMDFRITISPKK